MWSAQSQWAADSALRKPALAHTSNSCISNASGVLGKACALCGRIPRPCGIPNSEASQPRPQTLKVTKARSAESEPRAHSRILSQNGPDPIVSITITLLSAINSSLAVPFCCFEKHSAKLVV